MFFSDRIFRLGGNMLQSLKRVLSNFNVVAIQISLDGFPEHPEQTAECKE